MEWIKTLSKHTLRIAHIKSFVCEWVPWNIRFKQVLTCKYILGKQPKLYGAQTFFTFYSYILDTWGFQHSALANKNYPSQPLSIAIKIRCFPLVFLLLYKVLFSEKNSIFNFHDLLFIEVLPCIKNITHNIKFKKKTITSTTWMKIYI